MSDLNLDAGSLHFPTDEQIEAVAEKVERIADVELHPSHEASSLRRRWMTDSRMSARAHALSGHDSGLLRRRVAMAIAGRTVPARWTTASLANHTGASRAEIEAILADLDAEGLVAIRPSSTESRDARSGRTTPVQMDVIDLITDHLAERLAGAA